MATLEKRIYDGDQARLVLENEAFTAAMADLRQEIMEQWKNAPARDHEGRESLWALYKLSEKFEAHLTTSLETGVMAKLDLKHRQSLLEKARSAIGLTS